MCWKISYTLSFGRVSIKSQAVFSNLRFCQNSGGSLTLSLNCFDRSWKNSHGVFTPWLSNSLSVNTEVKRQNFQVIITTLSVIISAAVYSVNNAILETVKVYCESKKNHKHINKNQ